MLPILESDYQQTIDDLRARVAELEGALRAAQGEFVVINATHRLSIAQDAATDGDNIIRAALSSPGSGEYVVVRKSSISVWLADLEAMIKAKACLSSFAESMHAELRAIVEGK